MLVINNLTIKTFKDRTLIEDLNFVLNKGDKLAIIGEEGNGKSTLIKAIYNQDMVADYVNIKGEINGLSYSIGYLPQFIEEHWLDKTIQEFLLTESVESQIDYGKYDDLFIIINDLSKKGVDLSFIDENQLVYTLSGGEKVKIQLLKLMIQKPEIIFLDEPTNDLDINTLEWLETFIRDSDEPIIFISHDETLLEKSANRILHLEQLKKKQSSKWTLENIGYHDYYQNRIASIEKQNQVAQSERREHKKQLEKFRKIYQRVEHEQNVISRQDPSGARLLAKKMKAVKSLEHRFENKEFTEVREVEEGINLFFEDVEIPSNKRILDIKDYTVKLNEKVLCSNINLEVYGPKKVTIIGKNGIGKTTFIRQILRELELVNAIKVGYFPQNYQDLMDFDNNPITFLYDSIEGDNQEAMIRMYLGSLKFTREEMVAKLSNLSGGQLAKIFLVKLVLEKCSVLVLDEPTRNLSPLSNPVFRQIILDYKGFVLCITHDRKYIEEVSEIVYELRNDGLYIVEENH